jgi:ribosomal protein L28
MYGHARSHAMNASNRRFMPNLSKRKLVYDGKKQKMKVCTNCLRTLHKNG